MRRLFVVGIALALLLTACPEEESPVEAEPEPDPEEAEEPEPEPDPEPDQQVVISYANPTGEACQPYTCTVQPWGEGVSERTDGAVRIEATHGGALLGDDEMLEGIRAGTADSGWLQTLRHPSEFPSWSIASVQDPGLAAPEFGAASFVMRAMWLDFPSFEEEMDAQNLIPLFMTLGEAQTFLTVEPVETVDDFADMTLRGGLGEYQLRWFEGFAHSAVEMPFADFVDGLPRGIVDGTNSIATLMRDFELHQIAPYVTLIGDPPGFVPALGPGLSIVINKEWFEQLPNEYRRILLEEAKRLEIEQGAELEQRQADALAEMEEDGATVTSLPDSEVARLAAAAEPLWEFWLEDAEAAGLPGSEMVDRARELSNMSVDEVRELWEQSWDNFMERHLAE